MNTPTTPPETCPSCGGNRQAHHPICAKCHRERTPDPPVRELHWPTLMATAERHRIPVARVDRNGRIHTLRTAHDLHQWEHP